MKFCLNFWGDARKIAIEGSIIDLDPYIIPHFEGNMPHYVVAYSLHYFNAYVWRGNRLNGPKPTNWQSDFLKNRPDTFAPPQPNWQVMDIKQRLCNTLIPIPDLFGVKWEVLVNIKRVYHLPPLQHRDQLNMTLAANVAIKRTGGWPTEYWPEYPILL